MEAFREVYWNIPASWKLIFFLAAIGGFLIFLAGLWIKVSVWSQGRDEEDELRDLGAPGLIWLSIVKFFSRDCVLAKRLFARSWYRGVMLLFIVWGFLALFIGTALVTLEHYLDLRFFLIGRVYLVFSLLLDTAGGLLIIGLIAALVRRCTASLDRRITSPEDVGFLALLLLVLLLGYAVEGIRLALLNPAGMDWSPIGGLFAAALTALIPGESLLLAHRLAWLLHGIAAMVFIAYIPYSKLFHLFASQITTSMASTRYGGAVREA